MLGFLTASGPRLKGKAGFLHATLCFCFSLLQLYEVFTFLAERGGVAQVHAENGEIIAEVDNKSLVALCP